MVKLCEEILRLFAVSSVQDLSMDRNRNVGYGGKGFISTASLIGHLIEWRLVIHQLVRQHLVKLLIAHHYTYHPRDHIAKSIRAMAIYQLLAVARNTLLQGLLEPEDI